jgi:PAS domain S-box-containing protein
MVEKYRKTGINIIGDVSYGAHFCQFYQTREDLIDILVPYFKAGLENNEFCIWVTQEPLSEEEAKGAMRKALPGFDQYLKRGQIEIVPHTKWYLKDGVFNLQRVLNAWIDKLYQALSKGYDGIRATGNTAWLRKRDWKSFADYEKEVNNIIGKYRMIALCTYCLEKCGASEIIDVVNNHQFTLIRREGKWELIESYDLKRMDNALQESEKKYRDLVDNALVGIYKTNLKGDILYVNEALSKMLEFGSPEDMMEEGASARYKNPKDREVLIENLRKMNRVESFEIELLTKTGKTRDVLLSATLEGDMISGMIMDITMRKHLCEQVQISQGQLQNLSRRLMEVQESERRFLASELHDQIGQNLTALSINLNVIRSRFSEEVDIKIVDRLEDSLKLVEETIERVRSVMAGLRPPVLDDYGLAVALRWYTEQFSERNAVVTVVQEKEFLSCLPLTVETALFRIVQEVLTNVSKHANAKHVIITLERIDGVVQLVVSDDGVGFDPSVPRKLGKQPGWGLITIEERAKAMGGNVYVKSTPGKGTRIIVQVPC